MPRPVALSERPLPRNRNLQEVPKFREIEFRVNPYMLPGSQYTPVGKNATLTSEVAKSFHLELALGRETCARVCPLPYALHPTLYTLHPTPYALHFFFVTLTPRDA